MSHDSALCRRLLVLRLATTSLTVPTGAAMAQGRKLPSPAEPDLPRKSEPAPQQPRSGEIDADPSDEPGNGRGVAGRSRSQGTTDADPSDAPGRGRGGNAVTDADPGDQPGRGRGNAFTSDADPGDLPGQGRGGGRKAGPSDTDPGDPAGQGRDAAPPQLRTGRTTEEV